MPYSIRRALFKEQLVRWLFILLPERARRMLFVVSLAQLIRGDQALSDQTLAEINDLMDLGFSTQSIQYPIHIAHLIWKGLSSESVCGKDALCTYRELDETTIKEAVQSVKSHAKDLELYDSKKLEADIACILKHRNMLLAPAA